MIQPEIVVPGLALSGTTLLDRQFRKHPQLFLPAIKEINFFADPRQLSPLSRQRRVAQPEALADLFRPAAGRRGVDISPAYCSGGAATAAAIRDAIPHVRLLITLRHPVEREWSAWLRGGNQPSDIESFVAFLSERAAGYRKPIAPFVARFDPEQIKIILYEDLIETNAEWWNGVWRHLGVEEIGCPSRTLEYVNATGQSRVVNSIAHLVRLGLYRGSAPPWLINRARDLGDRLRRRLPKQPKPALPRALRRALLAEIAQEIEVLQMELGTLCPNLTRWWKDLA